MAGASGKRIICIIPLAKPDEMKPFFETYNLGVNLNPKASCTSGKFRMLTAMIKGAKPSSQRDFLEAISKILEMVKRPAKLQLGLKPVNISWVL